MKRLVLIFALAAIALSGTLVSDAGNRKAGGTFRDCEACPLMMTVPAGEFSMGSAPGSADGNGDESPVHRVTFAKPFALGIDEVTRGEFAKFATEVKLTSTGGCQVVRNEQWQTVPELDWKNPGFAQTDADPVVCVNWHEATQFIEWLSRKSGKPYRLPSEAEWEYVAVRGSAGRALSHESANYGAEQCCAGKAEGRDTWQFTAPAGSFPADALGLHDVLGNVWEWLADCYHESYEGAPSDGRAREDSCEGKRVVRGGSYGDGSALLRSAYRLRGPDVGRYATLGLRVARDLD